MPTTPRRSVQFMDMDDRLPRKRPDALPDVAPLPPDPDAGSRPDVDFKRSMELFATATRRQLTPDEVELQFTTAPTTVPRAKDWAVQALQRRHGVALLGGVVRVKSTKLGFTRWRAHWAELCNGMLVLRKFEKTTALDPKAIVIPTAGSKLRVLDARTGILEITYQYQHKTHTKIFQSARPSDAHVWWWMLQLASVHRLAYKELRELLFQVQAVRPDARFWELVGAGQAVLYPHGLGASSGSGSGLLDLILLRHGQTDNMKFQVEDTEQTLTQRGREQAAKTALHLKELLVIAHNAGKTIELVHGTLTRSRETADELVRVMPWLQRRQVESRLLDDGAPSELTDLPSRVAFRSAMHSLAHEFLLRPDSITDASPETIRIVIATSSFVQYCIAQCCQVSRDVVRLGASIAHCSITQIDVKMHRGIESMTSVSVNRVQHLPMTHRTRE